MPEEEVNDILRKYGAKIESQIATTNISTRGYSKSYLKFRSEMDREFSRYERFCHSLGSFVKLNPSSNRIFRGTSNT